MIRELRGVLHTLAGFKNNQGFDGTGSRFNFILDNGTRSTQYDEDFPIDFTHMIPKDALKRLRSVTIYYNENAIMGFSFFDKDGALLWKIGVTTERMKKE